MAVLTSLALAVGWLLFVSPAATADGPTAFATTTSIDIPKVGSADQMGPANPYPSDIPVSGLAGSVSKVTVTFAGLTHGAVADIDALVVAPTGANLVVLSDVGDPNQLVTANGVNLTFDDAAAGPVPAQLILPSGTYRPTNVDNGADSFPAPAPSPSNQTTLGGAFTGINPNGTWHLYIVDDTSGDTGTLAGGWSLSITTEVDAVSTTTSVATSNATSTTGDPVTFTASVKNGGTPVTAGSVQFSDGAAALGSPVALNASGQATLTTSALDEGTHLIRATYGGATGFLSSNGTVSQRVDNATTVTGTTFCNTGPITIPTLGPAQPYPSHVTVSGLSGKITKVTARLKGLSHQAPIDLDIMLAGPTPSTNLLLMSDAGGQNPVSNLDLTLDDAAAGPVPAPAVSGTYKPTNVDDGSSDTFPAPAPTPSAATALSTFNGAGADGQWSLYVLDDASGDSGSIANGWCLTITSQAATTTTLTSSANPSAFGTSVDFTATVTSGGSPVTTGAVQFSDAGGPLGSPVAVGPDGTAVLATSSLTAGSHLIGGVYSGDSTLAPSSDTLQQVVTELATTTTLTSTPNPSDVGQDVTLTATVTSGGAPVTTGTVQFSDGGSPLGAPVSLGADGTATATSALDAGTHVLAADYNGTTTYATSAASTNQVVNKLATTTTLASAPNPSDVGQGVTLTATVTSGGASVTTGSVQFSDGGSSLGPSVPVGPDGTANLTTSALDASSHSLSASYQSTPTYAGSTGTTTQTVDKLTTTTNLDSTPNPSDAGGAVTITATVTSGGAAVGEGDVTITVDGSAMPAIPVAADGTAGMSISALDPGTHTISAAYSGTDTYAASASEDLQQDVRPVASAGGPYTVAEGGSLSLDASGSTSDASYAWDLNGDGDFTDATGVSPTLTWDELEALGINDGPSNVTVTLRVTLGSLVSTDTATLEVTNTAPTATVAGDLTATVGVPFTVKVRAQDPSSVDAAGTFTYTVDWGDGSPVDTVTGPADPPVTHTYTSAGSFDASFTAADKDGGTSDPTTVTVRSVAAPATSTPTSGTPSTPTSGTPSTPTSGTPSTPTGSVTIPTSSASPVTVSPSSSSAAGLADTGSHLNGPLLLGILLIAFGGLLVVAVHSRRSGTARHRLS